MDRIYFEDIHTATTAYPYIDLQMKNINYIAHFHEEIEVVYVQEGELFAASDTAHLQLRKNDICVFMPGEIHSFHSFSSNHIYIIKILPEPSAAGIHFSRLRLVGQPIQPAQKGYRTLLHAIQKIAAEHTAQEYGYEYAVNQYLNRFLAVLLRNFEFNTVSPEERRQMERKMLLLRRVEEFVSQQYGHSITLDEAASYCGYSKYYFSHYFKEIAGISFLDYLTAFRINAARSRIELTGESLTEIAFACGFGSTRSFNRAFQRYYHITPTDFRKQIKGPLNRQAAH